MQRPQSRADNNQLYLSVQHSAEPLWDALICLKELIQNFNTSAMPCVQGAPKRPPV